MTFISYTPSSLNSLLWPLHQRQRPLLLYFHLWPRSEGFQRLLAWCRVRLLSCTLNCWPVWAAAGRRDSCWLAVACGSGRWLSSRVLRMKVDSWFSWRSGDWKTVFGCVYLHRRGCFDSYGDRLHVFAVSALRTSAAPYSNCLKPSRVWRHVILCSSSMGCWCAHHAPKWLCPCFVRPLSSTSLAVCWTRSGLVGRPCLLSSQTFC